jgi:DNA excision repair protein ERCC-2
MAYLTCKGTGRLTALEALERPACGHRRPGLRVLVMVPKDQACEHPDKACHGDACPLAAASTTACRPPGRRPWPGLAGRAAQRQVALRHGICPYYLGQELVRWADVLVGDVHHLFDGNGLLWGLMQALDWKLAVLVDEAHNLVERTRQMYSAELRASQVHAARRRRRGPCGRAGSAWRRPPAPGGGRRSALHVLDAACPTPSCRPCRRLPARWPSTSTSTRWRWGPLLDFHFELQRFQSWWTP